MNRRFAKLMKLLLAGILILVAASESGECGEVVFTEGFEGSDTMKEQRGVSKKSRLENVFPRLPNSIEETPGCYTLVSTSTSVS